MSEVATADNLPGDGGSALDKKAASLETDAASAEPAEAEPAGQTLKEGADSTTTEDAESTAVKAGAERSRGSSGDGDENKVTSSEAVSSAAGERGQKRAAGPDGGEEHKPEKKPFRAKRILPPPRDPSDVRESRFARDSRDARDRIEQNRRRRDQQDQVVDYVSRSDRALVGKGTHHCVECNLAFVSSRSEKLHRDSQRHGAVIGGKRPSSRGRQTPYVCYLCWSGYDSSGRLFHHYAGDEHVGRMKKYGVKSLLIDGRKIVGDRSPSPPACIEDCVVLDDLESQEEDAGGNEVEGEAAGGSLGHQAAPEDTSEPDKAADEDAPGRTSAKDASTEPSAPEPSLTESGGEPCEEAAVSE